MVDPDRALDGRRVETVILAAGRASRMGMNKLLADLDGQPVIGHVIDAVEEAGLSPPIVTIGHHGQLVRDALKGRRARFVEAPDHDQGLSQSLRSAIEALPEQTLAAIICLGDMPFIPARLLRRMAGEAAIDSILVPRFDGCPGNPVLWGNAWFPRLKTLSGDTGAKSLLGELAEFVQFVDEDDEGVRIDIDTPDALAAARERVKGNSGT